MLITNGLLIRWSMVNEAILELTKEKQMLREKIKAERVIKSPKPRKTQAPRNPERNEQIVTLFKEGQTMQEIGNQFGFSRENIRVILKRYGLSGVNGAYAKKTRNKNCSVEGCQSGREDNQRILPDALCKIYEVRRPFHRPD